MLRWDELNFFLNHGWTRMNTDKMQRQNWAYNKDAKAKWILTLNPPSSDSRLRSATTRQVGMKIRTRIASAIIEYYDTRNRSRLFGAALARRPRVVATIHRAPVH